MHQNCFVPSEKVGVDFHFQNIPVRLNFKFLKELHKTMKVKDLLAVQSRKLNPNLHWNKSQEETGLLFQKILSIPLRNSLVD